MAREPRARQLRQALRCDRVRLDVEAPVLAIAGAGLQADAQALDDFAAFGAKLEPAGLDVLALASCLLLVSEPVLAFLLCHETAPAERLRGAVRHNHRSRDSPPLPRLGLVRPAAALAGTAARRLQLVRDQKQEVKQTNQAVGAEPRTQDAGAAPPTLLRLGTGVAPARR